MTRHGSGRIESDDALVDPRACELQVRPVQLTAEERLRLLLPDADPRTVAETIRRVTLAPTSSSPPTRATRS